MGLLISPLPGLVRGRPRFRTEHEKGGAPLISRSSYQVSRRARTGVSAPPCVDGLGFYAYVADAAYYVVGRLLVVFYWHYFYWVGLILGAEDQIISTASSTYFDGAGAVFVYGVHVVFVFAIGSQGIVVAVDQDRGSGKEARIHAHAVASVDLQYDETLPVIAASFGFGTEAAQETLFELVDFFTFMLITRGSVAATAPSTWRTFSNSSSLGGRMLARLLTSSGSRRSSTERC